MTISTQTPDLNRRRYPVSGLCPEDGLILACARLSLGTGEANLITELLTEPLDWNYLIQTASAQGILPLLHKGLKAVDFTGVPREARERLQYQVLENAQWALHLSSEMKSLLALLESHGICAVPFKGPVLSALLYGSISMRQYGDLDLLIHSEDFFKAKELLISRGYRGRLALSESKEKICLRFYFHLEFEHETRGIPLELHWEALRWYQSLPLDSWDLWGRLQPIHWEGREIPGLGREDLLLLICIHGAIHCWARLIWICDVAALLELPGEMDWEKLLGQAERLHVKRMLLLGLYLGRSLLGAAVPDDLWQEPRGDAGLISLAKKVKAGLFGEAGSQPGILARTWFHLRLRQTWKDRGRFILQAALIPNDTDIDLLPIPPFLSFLYYLARPIRLLCTYALRHRQP